jgi:D-alanyl-D-alanine carboxypeptidase (penicillin-binding protein 5/6)
VVGLLAALVALPARAQTTTTAPPPPKAYVLFDADTGAVIAAANEHERRPVASTSKILTALVTVERLPLDAGVAVTERAAGMPARRIGLGAGQTWLAYDLLTAMLLVSANDAAAALADRIGGGPDGFAAVMAATGRRLGMTDDPVLNDPAGLDDGFSHAGGNRISAWDLAVATRALLARDDLRAIVARPEYRFVGGDGKPHRLRNHNRLLGTYPGAIGVKTGYTRRAGRCLVAAATRGGRTIVAVVLDAPDTYGAAAALLDRGFATDPASLAGRPHLPAPPEGAPVTDASPRPPAPAPPAGSTRPATAWYRSETARATAVGLVGGSPAVVILLRRRRRLRLARIPAGPGGEAPGPGWVPMGERGFSRR